MKKLSAILLSLCLALTFFGCSAKTDDTQTSSSTSEQTTEPVKIVNPLTGEEDYNEKAVGVRPVAVVVENTSSARPQWGITTPDIIVEGEVEGGISRMLWLYADYTSLPEKVGPLRSARPSYIKFSELFDSIYIHWGGSHSKSGYTGGYETIKQDKVDDIDGMGGGKLFGRDTTRSVSSEHRGIMHGKKLPEVIKGKGYRTKVKDSTTSLSFSDDASSIALSSEMADKVNVKFSSRTDTRKFKYNSEKKTYTTGDWKSDVSFKNVIVLMDDTKYITTPYKGSTTTYLNYTLKSGTGYYFANGLKLAVKWSAQNGKLELTDANGKAITLNTGKSYIALASSNNGGSVTSTANEQ